MKKLRAGILGATGSAGMEFVNALYDHPWFEVDGLYASPRNAGKSFSEATTFDTWHLPEGIKSITVRSLGEIGSDYDILCSALPSDIARDVEGECNIMVETKGELTRGMTVADLRKICEKPNMTVIERISEEEFRRDLVRILSI